LDGQDSEKKEGMLKVPDKFGFDHFGQTYGKYVVSCIDCEVNGPAYYWNEKMREMHFLTHIMEKKIANPSFEGEVRMDRCRVCGTDFEQERKRGRPRVLCYTCKPE